MKLLRRRENDNSSQPLSEERKPQSANSEFLEVPDVVKDLPLMQQGGFDIFENLLSPAIHQALLDEAINFYSTAIFSEVPVSDAEEVRGGTPARKFFTVPAGAVQDAFYQSQWTLDFLENVCGTKVIPTGERGTFTYYVNAGDYLDIHRDIETCDLAVISCLMDNQPDDSDSGALCLYPQRINEPLSFVRRNPESGACKLRLQPGQTMVMLGGIVPHAVLPVTNGQQRIVSLLCYRLSLSKRELF